MPTEPPLERARELLSGRSLIAIGAGGTTPAAIFATNLHQDRTGRLAREMTPLEFIQMERLPSDLAVMIFSAQARHPDTAAALAAARSREVPLVLVTQREPTEMADATGSGVVLQLPSLGGRDGFLATGSLIAMLTATARLYGHTLPSKLPAARLPGGGVLRQNLLVLFDTATAPAASDIEVRFHELGVGTVQLADYRNLAHGRHTGLARNIDSTLVIALVGPTSSDLAERTLRSLPPRANVLRLHVADEGPGGVIGLVATAAVLVLEPAHAAGVEPSKPKVPAFGRALYHLNFRRSLPRHVVGPVARKTAALGVSEPESGPLEVVAAAYQTWRGQAQRRRIEAVVCDYDGTVVETANRFEPPTDDVRSSLLRILDEGIVLGFATGRGDSLHRGLREWIPRRHWKQVMLGLHNGSWTLRLDEAAVEEATSSQELALASLILAEKSGSIQARLRPGTTQVSLTPTDQLGSISGLRNTVRELLLASSLGDLRVTTSAHSVDVTDRWADKTPIFAAMGVEPANSLIYGDQGQEGGNDFELLALAGTTISVGRCSTSLVGCWNTSPSGLSGPQALARSLASVQRKSDAHRIALPNDRS